MRYVLRILKELGIAIVLMGIMFAVGMFLFRNQLPFISSDIPNAVKYEPINMADYDIKGDLEDETDPTKTYTASNNSLRSMEKEYLIMTGSANPFSSNGDSEQDLPSETVTIENEAMVDHSTTESTEKVDAEKKDAVANTSAETATSKSEGTGETERELEPAKS